MTSLTDPEENTTYWTFDPLGRVATETINVSSADLTRTFSYDARGNLVRKVDRNGRVIDYAYDTLSRQTTETWYDNLTDADAQQNVRKTYSTEYDPASRVAAVGDGDYDFEYTYSILGNLTSTTQDLYGLTDDVVFSYTYDVLHHQTGVSAKIGSTDDYVNTYTYDHLGRVVQITQHGVSGGNAVAEKRIDFGYSDDSTRATISRFADLAGTEAVAVTESIFDELGRIADIVHERAATEFADYDFTWDAAGRITDLDFDFLGSAYDDDASYTYDDTSQLTDADYTTQTDEDYDYDANGNRTLVDGTESYTTGDHNRLLSDGTYNYTYDNEGNVLTKTNVSTSESVEYTWDHRNRLVKVTFKNSGGTPTKIVEYAYDYGQRWVRKTLDTNADQTIEESRVFVHDNGQIVLDFQKTGTAAASSSDLAHRYLWSNSVDQLLADETVDDGSEDDTAWALTDHLNSVRDLVVYDPVTGTVSVVKHVTFDAFGNVTSDSAPGVLTLFRYTARPFDTDAGIQNNLNRWYDLATGRWMSVDPIGFEAGDVNLYRYCFGAAPSFVDPSGLGEDQVPWLPTIVIGGEPVEFKEPTPNKYRLAVLKQFQLIDGAGKLKPRQDKDFSQKMHGWGFDLYDDTPVFVGADRDKAKTQAAGISGFLIRWEIDAKLRVVGGALCCDWSPSNLDFTPIYNVYKEFEKGKTSWVYFDTANGVYLSPGPVSIADHEIWHLKGVQNTQFVLTHKVEGNQLVALPQSEKQTAVVQPVKGMIPQAADHKKLLLEAFKAIDTSGLRGDKNEMLEQCRRWAKPVFDKFFLFWGARNRIVRAGEWHARFNYMEIGNNYFQDWGTDYKMEGPALP